MQKNVATCTRCRNKVELKLPYAHKLKTSVQNYVANYKFDSNFIVTAEEWQPVSHINVQLKPFYIVTQQCSKNNSLLSSVIPHAQALKKFVNVYAKLLESSSVSTTLAEIIEEACKRRFYTINNTSRLNLNDSSLLLVTTAVDPRSRLLEKTRLILIAVSLYFA